MDLKDLTPRPSKFYLSSTESEYTLRPWTLQDQIWLQQEYGDKINTIFSEENLDIVAICRMAYRLMVNKSDFKAKELVEIDEEGEEVKQKLGGYKLMISMIKDVKEQLSVMAAVVECIGLSMPEVDELKNYGNAPQKKTQLTKQTGEKS